MSVLRVTSFHLLGLFILLQAPGSHRQVNTNQLEDSRVGWRRRTLALGGSRGLCGFRKVTRVTPHWAVLLSAWSDKLETRTSCKGVSMSICKRNPREHACQLLRLRQGLAALAGSVCAPGRVWAEASAAGGKGEFARDAGLRPASGHPERLLEQYTD